MTQWSKELMRREKTAVLLVSKSLENKNEFLKSIQFGNKFIFVNMISVLYYC